MYDVCAHISKHTYQIWDTAGQERFRSMTSAFYSKAQGVVVTFDVSERDTFLALPSWIRDIRMVRCCLVLLFHTFSCCLFRVPQATALLYSVRTKWISPLNFGAWAQKNT